MAVNPLSPGESGQPEPKEFGILLYLRQRSDLGYFLVEAIRHLDSTTVDSYSILIAWKRSDWTYAGGCALYCGFNPQDKLKIGLVPPFHPPYLKQGAVLR
jgi:hypothetical protein